MRQNRQDDDELEDGNDDVFGLLLLLRDRIFPVPPPQPLAKTLQAALLLVGAALAPLAGWFVLAGLVLLALRAFVR